MHYILQGSGVVVAFLLWTPYLDILFPPADATVVVKHVRNEETSQDI